MNPTKPMADSRHPSAQHPPEAEAVSPRAERFEDGSRGEDRAGELAQACPAALLVLDGEGRIRRANPKAEAILGQGAGELDGRSFDTLGWTAPGSSSAETEGLEGASEPLDARALPWRLLTEDPDPSPRLHFGLERTDGRRVQLAISSGLLRPDEGWVGGLVLTLDDVTEEVTMRRELASYHRELERIVEERTAELTTANRRLQREAEELEKAERRQRVLTTAVEAVREGVAITDARLDGEGPRLLFVNDYFLHLVGRRAEELSGFPVRRLLAPGCNDEALARLDREISLGKATRGELIYRNSDGRDLLVVDHTSPVHNSDGELTHLISIVQDVDELRRSEEALRRSEERYALLIEQMNEGFVATDGQNCIDLANARFVEMMGYSRSELYGQYLGRFVDPEEVHRLEAQEAKRREGVAEPYELALVSKDGERVDTIISPTSLLADGGEFVGSFAVITDVTERKRLEVERRRLEGRIQKAQKMESLGLLAGGIAHDFNNLLVGMLGHAGLALMELDSTSTVRPLVRKIETAALRASELTKEMLAYSGKGKFIVEPIDLSELVREMAKLLEVSISKKASLVLNLESDLPPVEGDSTQIRQIVMNLITNASEAIGETSGTITITTGSMHADRRYLAATYMDDELDASTYVFLEVSDNGSGMNAETRAKIFDPFFTTKFTGRGLGLAAVLGIVRGHHGAIKVYSELGQGTSFKVLFPAVENEVRPSPPTPREDFTFEGSGCVLVVDDEEMVRGVAQLSLETVGFSVLAVGDGEEALEVFRREGHRIDAVLLDMTMPRLGGEETYYELQKLRPGLPTILTSGFNEQDTFERFSDQGVAIPFLQKPFQPQDLIRKIRDALGQ